MNYPASGVAYESCLHHAIEFAKRNGRTDWVKVYMNYPRPTKQEWDDCLSQADASGHGDRRDADLCMFIYEIQLLRRGIRTVLQDLADDDGVLGEAVLEEAMEIAKGVDGSAESRH